MFRQVKSGNAETIALTVGTIVPSNLTNVVDTKTDKLKTGYIGIVLQDKIYSIADGATLVGPGSTSGNAVAGLRVIMMGTDAPNYNGGVIVWDKTDAEMPVSKDFLKLDTDSNNKIMIDNGDICYLADQGDGTVILKKESVSTDTNSTPATVTDIKRGLVEYCGSDDKNVWIRIL